MVQCILNILKNLTNLCMTGGIEEKSGTNCCSTFEEKNLATFCCTFLMYSHMQSFEQH